MVMVRVMVRAKLSVKLSVTFRVTFRLMIMGHVTFRDRSGLRLAFVLRFTVTTWVGLCFGL